MSVRRSLGIASLTRMAVFVLSLGTVVVVSRLLTPEEIGIFSVSVALIGFGHIFRDFGVGQYLIQVKQVTREHRRAAFTVTLAFSWAVAMLLWAARPYAAAFYRVEGIADVLLVLGISFLILPFAAPLRTLLQRDMQFGKLAIVGLVNQGVQSGVTIAMAWSGASYMSMAWGAVAGNLANVVVLLCISPRGALDWPTRHGLGDVLRFGSRASAAALTGEAGAAAPDLILGRTLGLADVAFFSRANSLISMVLRQLLDVVRNVYTPAFAKGMREGHDGAAVYTRTMGLLLGVTLPAMGVLALLSPYLIVFMFGPQWQRSGPLGAMLCVFAMLIAPFALAGASLVATGHIGLLMRYRFVIEVLRIAALLVSVVQPLEVVVATLGLVYAAEAVLFQRALGLTLGLRLRPFWSGIARSYALVPAALVGPAGFLLAFAGDGMVGVLGVLCWAAALAAAGWLGGVFLLHHPLRGEIVKVQQLLMQKLRAKRLGRDK